MEKGEDSCLRRWEELEKRVMCDEKGFCKNKRKDVHGGGRESGAKEKLGSRKVC